MRYPPIDPKYQIEGDTSLIHIYGFSVHTAPVPPRLHICTPWSMGWIKAQYVEQCACGAFRLDCLLFGWTDKNSRRRNGRPVDGTRTA